MAFRSTTAHGQSMDACKTDLLRRTESCTAPVPDSSEAPDSPRIGRIALVTQGYQSAGGVQAVARWLVKSLKAQGYEVAVFDLATSTTDAFSQRILAPRTWRRESLVSDRFDHGVIHVGAKLAEVEALRYLPRKQLTAKLNTFDLVQVVSGGSALAFATVKARVPVTLQVATTASWERSTGLSHAISPTAVWRRAMCRITSVIERMALRRIDAVLVENRRMEAFVRSVSPCRVILAPPGIDTKLFTPDPEGWRAEGYLLSVCRFNDARKGLDRLIRAYALMVIERPDLPSLVLAGSGVPPEFLTELSESLGLGNRVRFRPDVPSAEISALYQGASVYLQASYEEGLGISVLEAMSCGLPVVSTATAGTLETVSHGITGWLVPQDADVERELALFALSVFDCGGSGMGRSGRQRVEDQFSERVAFARFIDTYRELKAVTG